MVFADDTISFIYVRSASNFLAWYQLKANTTQSFDTVNWKHDVSKIQLDYS